MRLTAISQTFNLQADGNSKSRLLPEALTLTAACVWLLNSIHARPEDGPSARRLMDAVLPVTEARGATRDILAYNTAVQPDREVEEEEEEEEEEEGSEDEIVRAGVPYNPHGCIFLRRMMVGAVPRLRAGGPVLPSNAFKYWFGGMTIEEVSLKYRTTGIIDKTALVGRRAKTNKAKMSLYINLTGEPEPELFNMGAQGYILPPPTYDDGSDLEDRESPSPPQTLDAFLSQLWRQFCSDVMNKSPNQRGSTNPSYLKATPVQRQEGKEDIYKNLVLSDVFTHVHYRNGSPADWERAFKWLFPQPGQMTTNDVQNYPSCPYFKMWMEFVAEPNNGPEFLVDVRRRLWDRLRNWEWIPDAQQDKMWPTKALRGFTRWPPVGKAAPRILLKERRTPVFRLADDGMGEGEIEEVEEEGLDID
jgi:hypothetical protein